MTYPEDHLIVEMVSSRETGGTHGSDNMALVDALFYGDPDRTQVCVSGTEAVFMPQEHTESVATHISRLLYETVSCGEDQTSRPVGDVHPCMVLPHPGKRRAAAAEWGSDEALTGNRPYRGSVP